MTANVLPNEPQEGEDLVWLMTEALKFRTVQVVSLGQKLSAPNGDWHLWESEVFGVWGLGPLVTDGGRNSAGPAVPRSSWYCCMPFAHRLLLVPCSHVCSMPGVTFPVAFQSGSQGAAGAAQPSLHSELRCD